MTGKDSTPLSQDPVAQQAIRWLVLLRSGEAGLEERHAFIEWRLSNPRHEQACAHLEATLGVFQHMNHQGVSGQVLQRTLNAPSSRRQILQRSFQFAALATGLAALGNRLIPIDELTADMRTGTGERRTFRLEDGSDLTLNARSAADVYFDNYKRHLHLRSGSGFIRISKDDQRAFTAASNDCLIRPVGNSLLLTSNDVHGEVMATRAPVEVFNRSSSMLVPSGGAAFYDAHSLGPLRKLSGGENAWVDGFFEARNLSLDHVVNALKPYRAGIIQVNQDIAQLRVSGRFPLDDSDLALAALTQVMPIRLHWRTPLWVTLEPA